MIILLPVQFSNRYPWIELGMLDFLDKLTLSPSAGPLSMEYPIHKYA